MTSESEIFPWAPSSSFCLHLHQKSFKLLKHEEYLLRLLHLQTPIIICFSSKAMNQRGIIGGWKWNTVCTPQCLLELGLGEATPLGVTGGLNALLSWSLALENRELQSRNGDWLWRLAGSMRLWIQVYALEHKPDFLDARVIWVCVHCLFWRVLTVLSGTCNLSPKPIALFSNRRPHFTTITHSCCTRIREVLRENNDPN